MSNAFWDERFSGDEYLYGTEPNDFLRAEVGRIPKGPVVCLAEGEGRNAVFLASLGYTVTAVDFSVQGLRKAEALAKQRGVELTLVEADLATYDLGVDAWTGIVSMWAHTVPAIRGRLHRDASRALVPGGAFVLEAYRPEQLAYDTGGPKDPAMLPSLELLRRELSPLEIVVGREVERDIREGTKHIGMSATVQVVAIRSMVRAR